MKKHQVILLFFIFIFTFASCNLIKENELHSEISSIKNGLKYGTILERMEAWDIPGVSIAVVVV